MGAMCGRYTTTMDPETLYGLFQAEPEETDPPAVGRYGGDAPRPRYNIAPTTDNPVIRVRAIGDEPPKRRLELLHWGLVPSWAKDPSVGNRMFNARAESVPEKPAFRRALEKRRCLVPASGFFEWKKTGTAGRKAAKQPFYITPEDGSVMAFAGLWEYWRPRHPGDGEEPGDPIVSYTILTTDAVGEMADIHDRMPLVLPAVDWDSWLDPSSTAEQIDGLLVPPAADLVRGLEFRPVDPRVGNVNNDDPTLLERWEPTLASVPVRADEQLALPLS